MLPKTLTPVLVHIQSYLDDDLSLDSLAQLSGLSAYHFHRLFHAWVGETVKQYTNRLRLERAAFRLLLHKGTILDIALECGFHNHETFVRAFRKRFGMTPREYRKRKSLIQSGQTSSRRTHDDFAHSGFELSNTQVRVLHTTPVAFIRHIGPYEAVSEALWDELATWAQQRRIPEPYVLLGIGHDSPSITPAERLRFDAALRIPAPIEPDGYVGHQMLAGGLFAVTTHVGQYATLPAAYQQVFSRLAVLKGYRLVGLPCIEMYRTTRVNQHYNMNHTDIYVPLERSGPAAS